MRDIVTHPISRQLGVVVTSLILQPPFPVPLLRHSIRPEDVHLSGYTLGIRLEACGCSTANRHGETEGLHEFKL